MSDRTRERVVKAACPHDCPDTCAMLVTVDGDGRATRVEGDPDHPVTAGFLCGKVSNYLERVYAEDRVLDPLIRTGAKGDGRFRRAGLGRGAGPDRRAAPGGDRGARRRDGAAVLLPRDDGVPAGRRDERALLQRARGERARAHDLRERRRRRRARHARRLARGRPGALAERAATCSAGAGTRCRPRRTCGASSSPRGARGPGSWSSIPSAAAPRAWPTSTCARSRAPTGRSRSG